MTFLACPLCSTVWDVDEEPTTCRHARTHFPAWFLHDVPAPPADEYGYRPVGRSVSRSLRKTCGV